MKLGEEGGVDGCAPAQNWRERAPYPTDGHSSASFSFFFSFFFLLFQRQCHMVCTYIPPMGS